MPSATSWRYAEQGHTVVKHLACHKQSKFTVQHNTVMSHNIVLHVVVRTNHQALLIITIKKKNEYILACNCSVVRSDYILAVY